MELKRIVAPDNRTATARATALYGKDALVISTERVNGQIELIVAVDMQPDLHDEPAPAPRFAGMKKPAGFGNVLQGQLTAMTHASSSEPATTRLAERANATDAAAAAERDKVRAQELVSLVREELAEMRRELRIARQTALWQSSAGLSPVLRPLVDGLNEAGVPAALRALLLDEVKDAADADEALGIMRTFLKTALRREPAAGVLTGVHAIAGPSGCGKTLMIGRLAALHAQQGSADDVAIIAFSDKRAGAWSQMQFLAAQTGVDCYRAQDAGMLTALLDELAGRKLILIDTAGVQLDDHLGALRSVCPQAQIHLLLPADASAATVRRHLQGETQWASLMLSKLDECAQPWPLIAALSDRTVPLSYAGSGPQLAKPVDAARTTDRMVDAALAHLPLAYDTNS